MATWTVPAKLPYALFVAGDARLGETARPALDRVLKSLAAGPPPAVDLRTWIVEHARMGTLDVDAMRAQVPPECFSDPGVAQGAQARLGAATNAMIVAAAGEAALDPRAPWGLLVLAATLASASGGLVYDSETFRIIPQVILENPLDGFLLGSIKNHVKIFRCVDGARSPSLTTLGLNKYGVFEIALGADPEGSVDVASLLVGLAQSVVDARPAASGAWDVPADFDVTRRHIAHAVSCDDDVSGGRVCFTLRPDDFNEMYWRAALTSGPLESRLAQST